VALSVGTVSVGGIAASSDVLADGLDIGGGARGGGMEVMCTEGGACLIDMSEPKRKCCTTGNLAMS
jgi:hypothetical protein